MLSLRMVALVLCAIPVTLAHGVLDGHHKLHARAGKDEGLLASDLSPATSPAVSALNPPEPKDLMPLLAANADKDPPSGIVITLTIPGQVETSYFTESARVTVVTISASDSSGDSTPASTPSDTILTFSLPSTTLTLQEPLPTPTENSLSTTITTSVPSTISTLQGPSPLPTSTGNLVSSLSATVATGSSTSQEPAILTSTLPPTYQTPAPIVTSAPVVNSIYSTFTSFPDQNKPRTSYNASSSIIPVWSPELLGNAYGGGLIRIPTVFALVQPQATGTLRGIAPAYGYTVFPLDPPTSTTATGNGTDKSSSAYAAYTAGGFPPTGFPYKDPPSSATAISSAWWLQGGGRSFPGNGSYRVMEGPPAGLFDASLATKDIVGMATLAAGLLVILAVM